jgi:hypothetical protein
MKYTVVWTPTAEHHLAELWLQSSDRNAVRSATDTIDKVLTVDAHVHGESRYETLRVLVVAPLGVDFDVDQNDCLVRVLRIWRTSL